MGGDLVDLAATAASVACVAVVAAHVSAMPAAPLVASALWCLVRAVACVRRLAGRGHGLSRCVLRAGRALRRWGVELREGLQLAVVTLTGFGALWLAAPSALAWTGLTPSLPLPLGSYRVSSPFGPRRDPFTGALAEHRGTDLAAPEGTPVYAARAGRVIAGAGSFGVANGLFVAVRDAEGRTWYYLHLSRQDVDTGQEVAQGAQLGAVGATGRATGPHLHLQVYGPDGALVDPETLFPGGL